MILSENARGAVYMMVGMAGFVANDALVKLASADLTLFQAVFVRGVFATAMLLILAARSGVLRPRVEPGDRRLVALRTLGEIGGTLCFLTALFNMPIANATAILQSMPLAVTLAASLFLREPVGWRRYSAILVGFLGVLIIVRPGTDGFTAYSLWALAAVGFMVLRDLSTRRMTAGLPSVFVALVTATAITLVGGIGSLTQGWSGADLSATPTLALAAVFLIFGYLFNVMSMRHGEIGFVSPFRYTILLWAILLGWIVFGDVPDAAMLIGSAIVVATGAYTFYRERQVRKRAAAAHPFGGA